MEYTEYKEAHWFPGLCKDLIKAKLYQYKTWQLYRLYTEEQHRIQRMVVAYEEESPVAVAVFFDPPINDINISVFVSKDYRRQGIGTQLIQLLAVERPSVYRIGYRDRFWNNALSAEDSDSSKRDTEDEMPAGDE